MYLDDLSQMNIRGHKYSLQSLILPYIIKSHPQLTLVPNLLIYNLIPSKN